MKFFICFVLMCLSLQTYSTPPKNQCKIRFGVADNDFMRCISVDINQAIISGDLSLLKKKLNDKIASSNYLASINKDHKKIMKIDQIKLIDNYERFFEDNQFSHRSSGSLYLENSFVSIYSDVRYFLAGIPAMVWLATKKHQGKILKYLLDSFGNSHLNKLALRTATLDGNETMNTLVSSYFDYFDIYFASDSLIKKKHKIFSKKDLMSFNRAFASFQSSGLNSASKRKIEYLLDTGFPSDYPVDSDGNNFLTYYASTAPEWILDAYKSRGLSLNHVNNNGYDFYGCVILKAYPYLIPKVGITATTPVNNNKERAIDFAWKVQRYGVYHKLSLEGEFSNVKQEKDRNRPGIHSLVRLMEKLTEKKGFDVKVVKKYLQIAKRLNSELGSLYSNFSKIEDKVEEEEGRIENQMKEYAKLDPRLKKKIFYSFDRGSFYLAKISKMNEFEFEKFYTVDECLPKMKNKLNKKNIFPSCQFSSLRFKKGILYYSKDAIYLFHNIKSKPIVLKTKSKVQSVTHDGDRIFVSYDRSIAMFSSKLKSLDEVPNPVPKAAHHIVFNKNIIYALDNFYSPVFIFRVKVGKKSLKVLNSVGYGGVNFHLDDQIIDNQRKNWLIFSSYGHRGGAGTDLEVRKLDGTLIKKYPISANSYGGGVTLIDRKRQLIALSDSGKKEIRIGKVYYDGEVRFDKWGVIPYLDNNSRSRKSIISLPPFLIVYKDNLCEIFDISSHFPKSLWKGDLKYQSPIISEVLN